jgi:hypothetical protein
MIDKTLTINEAAAKGDLETLQWIRANGGEWTSDVAVYAAMNGHLEVRTALRGTDTWIF